jgi:hypothetical protein
MYLFQCPHIAKLWSELKVSQEKNIRAEVLWNCLETLNLPMAEIASALGKAKQNHFQKKRYTSRTVIPKNAGPKQHVLSVEYAQN